MFGLELLGSALSGGGNMLFNAFEAEENRDFQSDMSNSQYQRAAKDLEKAGLNRVLALGGGASTPSGAQATSSENFMGNYTQAASAKAAIAQAEAQTKAIAAQEEAAEAAASNTRTQEANSKALLPFQIEQLKAQSRQQNAAAVLSSENAGIARMEKAKQEVIKAGYDAGAPLVKKAVDAIPSTAKQVLQAPLDFFQGVENAGRASAKEVRERLDAAEDYLEEKGRRVRDAAKSTFDDYKKRFKRYVK